MLIEGRTFIVSGGASGLGRATVNRLCQNGAYMAVLDTNEELGRALINSVGHDRARFFTTDVLRSESIKDAVNETLAWARQTGKEIGGVVAAAGVVIPAKVSLSRLPSIYLTPALTSRQIIDRKGAPLDLDGYDFVMNVNVRGSVDLIRQVVPHLCKVKPLPPDGERGVIVLVSSSAAFEGQPGQVAYSASKGAIASLTLPLTRDLAGYGIRVITIAPSLFDTAMSAPMSDRVRNSVKGAMEFPPRAGKPDEFASLVQHGIENIMLNGVVIRLDGGMRMPSRL